MINPFVDKALTVKQSKGSANSPRREFGADADSIFADVIVHDDGRPAVRSIAFPP